MPKHTQEEAKPRWFVVNMCSGRWNQTKLNRATKPQLLFHSLAEAFAYAAAMADQHNTGDYAVFECIGRLVSNPSNPPGTCGLKIPTAKEQAENAISQGQPRTCVESGASPAKLLSAKP